MLTTGVSCNLGAAVYFSDLCSRLSIQVNTNAIMVQDIFDKKK
jgi:hypothetical protein